LLAYLYAIFSGTTDASRAVFLYGSLAGGIIVVGGLIWESGKINRATAVVIFGVCLETFCTWRLFVVDEKTFADLLEPRKLSQEQKGRIAQAIKPFPSVSFVAATAPGEEPWEFVLDISRTLRADGWKWEPFPENAGYQTWQSSDANDPPEGMTLSSRVVLVVPPALEEVAHALARALTEPSVIGMEDVPVIVNPKATRMNVIAGTKR
jgi:hypothetical protein